jgi:hypothetical protein
MSNISSICVLINTCPKYNDIAIASCVLIRRYAPALEWPIFLASSSFEAYHKTELEELKINVIEQTVEENADFIKSRIHALHKLKDFSNVLFLQEDFLLDREPMYLALEEAARILQEDASVKCVRLMPCPAPTGLSYKNGQTTNPWSIIDPTPNAYFSFQASIWNIDWLHIFFERLLLDFQKNERKISANKYWLLINPAEKTTGMIIALDIGGKFIGYERKGNWPNAVFLSPWPYRPTAVEKGNIQSWASDFLEREGFTRPSS